MANDENALYQELDQGLLQPVYLLYGDDMYLMDQAVQRISAIASTDRDNWNRALLDGETCEARRVAEESESGGFFGTKKLVIVRNARWFKNKPTKKGEEEEEGESAQSGASFDAEPLCEYLSAPSPDTVLIMTVFGAARKDRRLYKLAAAAGRIVEIVTLKGGQREQWLRRYFKSQGKEASLELCQYISLMSADTVGALKNEADKLLLYVGDSPVLTLADGEALVSDNILAVTFNLVDNMTAGRAPQAMDSLERLLRQGEKAPHLLGAIANQYRTMLASLSFAASGGNPSVMASEMRLNSYFAKKCWAAGKRYQQEQLIRALDILLAADRDGKTGRQKGEDALRLAVLRICALG